MIRAKFRCESARKDAENENVSLRAVYAEDGPNKDWSKWTPNGQVTMTISNPQAQGKFEEGKEYFLDFTPAT